VVQTDNDELEWDLEPGLESDSPRHKLKSQSSLEFGNDIILINVAERSVIPVNRFYLEQAFVLWILSYSHYLSTVPGVLTKLTWPGNKVY